jgi:GT2 family glycosyltransferase
MAFQVSVIIVSYNTAPLLRSCLESLQSTAKNIGSIVVDNNSSDGSPELVKGQFPNCRLIENSENVGFPKANNLGISHAHGNSILLLNSDTIVRPGALNAMSEFLDAHPDAGGVTCRLLNADGSIQACVSRRPSPTLLFFRLSRLSRLIRKASLRRFLQHKWVRAFCGTTLSGYLEPYTATGPLEIENISGACLMLRRRAIEQVGLLDENFFMYFEDMDYCLRLRAAGWKLYYVPDGEIVHLVGQSSGGRMRDYSLHSYRSLFYFYKKHYSFWAQAAVRLIVIVNTGIRWLFNLISSFPAKSSLYRQNRQDLAKVMRLCLTNFFNARINVDSSQTRFGNPGNATPAATDD